MAAYTKEFLIEVFMSRYMESKTLTVEDLEFLESLASNYYDTVDKTTFRTYCGLDAAAISNFKQKCVN